MIVNTDFQIISGYGWLEITEGIIKTRKNGIVGLGGKAITPPRIHVHEDGVTITGLPADVMDWLRQSIKWESEHDAHNEPLPEPMEKQARIVIRL